MDFRRGGVFELGRARASPLFRKISLFCPASIHVLCLRASKSFVETGIVISGSVCLLCKIPVFVVDDDEKATKRFVCCEASGHCFPEFPLVYRNTKEKINSKGKRRVWPIAFIISNNFKLVPVRTWPGKCKHNSDRNAILTFRTERREYYCVGRF